MLGTLQLILFGAGTTAVVVEETVGKLRGCSGWEGLKGILGADLIGVICSFWGLINGDIGEDVLLHGVTGDNACSEILLLLLFVISSALKRKKIIQYLEH